MEKLIQTGALIVPVVLFSACNTKQKIAEQKPLNIIHIMTDDHSYQTLSAYGHPLSKLAPTPNLDIAGIEKPDWKVLHWFPCSMEKPRRSGANISIIIIMTTLPYITCAAMMEYPAAT